MSTNEISPPPDDAPKTGEVYAHFKTGNRYRVAGLAWSADDEWVVLYQPLYDSAIAETFTRPVAEWHTPMAWEGKMLPRFTKDRPM